MSTHTEVKPDPHAVGAAPKDEKKELNSIETFFIYAAAAVVVLFLIYWVTEPSKSKPADGIVVIEFKTFGEGHATRTVPLKMYIDPSVTHIRATGPVKFVFVEDPTVFFLDVPVPDEEKMDKKIRWSRMMKGKYYAYSLEKANIFINWW